MPALGRGLGGGFLVAGGGPARPGTFYSAGHDFRYGGPPRTRERQQAGKVARGEAFCSWGVVRLALCSAAKGKQMTIKPEDVKRIIESADDFGFEMRVGQVLKGLADDARKDIFNGTYLEPPEHGGTYTDSITSKPRQFDFRCRIIRRPSVNVPTQGTYCALLAIECKNLHESAPVVVCGCPRAMGEAYYDFIVSHMDDSGRCMSLTTRRVEHGQFYQADEFVGKSCVRLGEKVTTQAD